ncbi:hypothetical protein [Kitasatospora camelliae]|uniref:Secreted protein with PEP-CTERM sorting signal n=1 Tax=Kitasatospora camelliae TaxID=3156397 RepID=A0AAU8JUQ5_9ACTN
MTPLASSRAFLLASLFKHPETLLLLAGLVGVVVGGALTVDRKARWHRRLIGVPLLVAGLAGIAGFGVVAFH